MTDTIVPISIFDNIFAICAIASPFLGGFLAFYIKKAMFYIKAMQQAIDLLNSMKTANKIILAEAIEYGDNPELVELLEGKVGGMLGLGNIQETIK